jgi:hypothetical protein
MSLEVWGGGDEEDYDHLLEAGWLTSEDAAELKADRDKLLAAIIHVCETFEKDEAQGYRSKDRQFAIAILRQVAPLTAGDHR